LVAHLGERVVLICDYKLPITPKSERLLVGFAVKDAEQVADVMRRAWENDPGARRLDIDGHMIWEIINEEENPIPELDISGVGSPLPVSPVPSEDDAREEVKLPNSAITVVHGYLVVATDVELLSDILKSRPATDRLSQSVDYQLVNHHLDKLGAKQDSFRHFSRTDEAYCGTYELIRQGKMPESETLLGRLLNRLLGPEEEGVLRKQQLDGSKLPEYQIVRRYLGPSGLFATAMDDGWFVTGVLLSKQQPVEDDAARLPLTTAAAEPATDPCR
jgi:hypothetical protein